MSTLEDTLCIHTILSLVESYISYSQRDKHMDILCQVSLCDLFLDMVTHHLGTSYEPLSPCWSHQTTVSDKDTLFKTKAHTYKLRHPQQNPQGSCHRHTSHKTTMEAILFPTFYNQCKTHLNFKQRYQWRPEIRQVM